MIILSGSTTSDVIQVLPGTDSTSYGLTSDLVVFDAWDGHIASVSLVSTTDSAFCLGDTTMADSVSVVLGGTDCKTISTVSLTGASGSMLLNGTQITSINPLVSQSLTGIDILDLNSNQLDAIPEGAFANLDKLGELYLDTNQIATIGENAFDYMSSLTELVLSENNLTEIPANLYSDLASLEYLYLSDNQIASVDVDAFDNLPSLQKLRLFTNNISSLSVGVFDDLKASEIDLSDNNLADLPLNLLKGHTNPQDITIFDITDNPLTNSSHSDYKANGWQITDVAWIQASGVREFALSIGHALPTALSVSFSVENGTVANVATGTVTIDAGSTTSNVITVMPSQAVFSLTSELTTFDAWKGYIGVATKVVDDSPVCGIDPQLELELIALSSANNCFDVLLSEFTVIPLSTKQIANLDLEVVQGLTAVTDIELDNNDLTSISQGIFANLTNLTDLDLNTNEISSIGANAFANLSSLTELRLDGNNLDTIPANLYSNLPNLEKLWLYNNNNPSIDAAAFANLPKLNSLRLQNQEIDGGLPQGVFAGLTSLDELYLQATGINSLSTNAFADTKLQDLRLQNNQISTLDSGIFDNLPLTYVDLSNNELTGLPKGLFVNHPNPENIATFNLDGNPLTNSSHSDYKASGWQIMDAEWINVGTGTQYRLSIDHALPQELTVSYTVTNGTVENANTGTVTIEKGGTLSNVITVVTAVGTPSYSLTSQLTQFSAWSGHIGSAELVPPSFFCGLQDKLEIFLLAYFAYTSCHQISVNDLAGAQGDLLLGGAGITDFPAVFSQSWASLSRFFLQNNELTQVLEESFANLSILTDLHLQENEISTIGDNAFANMPQLAKLYLNDNSLTEVPANLYSDHPLLDALHLHNNNIISINVAAFANLPKLEQLYLDNTSISTMPLNLFDDLTSLTELRLQNNQIGNLPSNIFSYLTVLTELRLQNNQIGNLPSGLFAGLSELSQIHLQDNQISTFGATAFDHLPLTLLDLSNNNLTQIPKDLFVNHPAPEQLVDFDISGNPLTSVGDAAFNANGWEITDVEWEEGSGIKKYRLSIDHALPAALSISFTVVNGTVADSATGTVTILAGSTTSSEITVAPSEAFYSLTSELTKFNDWNGHIDSSTKHFDDSLVCGIDPAFESALIALSSADTCFDVVLSEFTVIPFTNKGIASLDPSVVQGLTSATEVKFDNNALTSISQEVFANLVDITELELQQNEISEISVDAFANMSSLTKLHLYSNSLNIIPANLYSNLANLESLFIYDNDNPSIDAAAFANLPALTSLRLQNQEIDGGLPEGVFAGLGELKELFLQHTNTSELSPNMFANLTNLIDLRLYSNQISKLDVGVFDNLPLIYLDLRNNQLTEIPKDFFINHTKPEGLTAFRITGNPLTTVGDPAYNVNGWEITDAQWIKTANEHTFRLSIGHALPFDLTVPFSVTNSTDDTQLTATVTIPKGETTSNEVTLVPLQLNYYSLISDLTIFSAWSGHIGSATIGVSLSPACGIDPAFESALISLSSGSTCEDVILPDFTELLLQDYGIENLDVTVIQELTSVTKFDLGDNDLTSISQGIFANLDNLNELYLDQNEIVEIGENAFANMASLKELRLENNNLTTIPADLYSNLPNLQSLWLYNNYNPSIDAEAFANLPKLASLRLQNQDIEGELPQGVFAGLSALQELYLEFTSISDLPPNVFTDLTALKELRLYNNQISTLDVGVFDNLPLTHLDLRNNELTGLPKDLFVNHPNPENLATFTIHGNPLTTVGDPAYSANGWEITDMEWISASPFDGYRLSIGHALPADLTVSYTLTNATVNGASTGTTTIVSGQTTSSIIAVVPSQITYSLTAQLSTFDTWSGYIDSSTKQVNSAPVCGSDPQLAAALILLSGVETCSDVILSSLIELPLGNENIASLKVSAIQGLTSATKLELNDNVLTSIPAGIFANLDSLKELDLKNNQISAIGANAFADISSLTELRLDSNNLNSIPANLYSNLPNLETLWLYSNDNPSIDAAAFANLPKLTSLRLQNQDIAGGIPQGVFAGLDALEELFLQLTGIDDLPTNAFADTALKELHLYSNQISMLDAGVFDNLALTYVDLSNNKLVGLPKDLFVNHPTPQDLVTFNIDDNPLTTVGDAAYNANGWEITDAKWIKDSLKNEFRFSIAHALPADLTVAYTTVNGTIAGDSSGTLTIKSGETTSYVITVEPTQPMYSLTSLLTTFDSWSGYIDSATIQGDAAPVCGIDPALEAAILLLSGAATCFDVVLSDFTELLLPNENIASLDVPLVQGLTSVTKFALNENDLTSIPAGIFADLDSMTELLLNHNDISEIGAGAFDNMSNLKELYLQFNNLTAIPANLYSNLPNLEVLILGSNDNPIIDIAAFENLFKLKTLDLANQEVGEPTAALFADLITLEDLSLKNTGLFSLDVNVFSDLTTLTKLRLQHNQLSSIPVGLFDNLPLTDLSLLNNDLTSLPKDLFRNHPNPQDLTSFDLDDNPLTTLDNEKYNANGWEITSVEWLKTDLLHEYSLKIGHALPADLTVAYTVTNGTVGGASKGTLTIPSGDTVSNTITVVPSQTLYDLTSDLTRFDPWSGHIVSVKQYGTISPVCGIDPALKTAIVALSSAATCADVVLADLTALPVDSKGIKNLDLTVVQGLTSVTNIRLDKNKLTSLADQIFANLAKLKDLDLSDNQISAIGANAFANLSGLEDLQLSGNNLIEIAANLYSNLPNLQQLALEGNDNPSIDAAAFANLPKLAYLNLANQEIASLPAGVFSGLSALEELYLQNTSTSALTANMFSDLSALDYLYLNNNQIESIDVNAFSNLHSLVRLRLNENSIDLLPADVFDDLTSLNELLLQNNQINSLAVGLFDNLPLTSVDLQSNSLTAIPKDLFVNHLSPINLVSFNIADNPLTTVGDPAYNANGWEITQAAPVSYGILDQYRIRIGHVLPYDITVSYTLMNATVDGAINAETTIKSGQTTSDVIDVVRDADKISYSLTSHLTEFEQWGGHIGGISFVRLEDLCISADETFLNGILALLGGYDCSDIKIQDLWGLDGTLDLSQEGITAINPLFTQALSGLEALKLNSNELTQVPSRSLCESCGPNRTLSE